MRHPCGCENEVHAPSGVLHSVRKCDKHRAMQRDPATLDGRYYEELGIIKDGKLLPTKHVEELTEALGEIPRAPRGYMHALEIGAGVTPYGDLIEAGGWRYHAIEPSRWAASYLRDRYGERSVIEGEFGDLKYGGTVDLILAAHVIEHMEDAPGAIARCARLLAPGGELWVIVPDDSDPVNPDHLWVFTEATLRATIESAGLVVDRMAVRKHVERESFIYARARKPA